MRYMLLVYSPEDAWAPDEWGACVQESSGICHELAGKGQFLAASPLHPVATAKSVRVREGRTSITKGPFAETAEQLGGFFLVDVPHLDAAIGIAARLPAARKGTVEVRPVHRLENLPEEKLDFTSAPGEKFLLLCYDDEQAWTDMGPNALKEAMAEATGNAHTMASKGHYLSAAPLEPISTATSVRVREGKRLVTDGPFAETREFLGGYFLLTVNSEDEALAYAALHPGARFGTTEVRRMHDLSNMPAPTAAN